MADFVPSDFPLFRPAGAGSGEISERLTRLGINYLIPSLLALSEATAHGSKRELRRLSELEMPSGEHQKLSNALAESFEREGSDKARHGYHTLYARILKDMVHPVLFEVGLGSNDPRVPSNMGASGSPGASLRAFRRALVGARVMGGDVDPSTIGGHEFETFLLDQLDMTKFPTASEVGAIDLLIDDGLHMPASNINTLAWGFDVISKNGVIVVEDIPDASLPVWKIVHSILPSRLAALVFAGAHSNAFVVGNSTSIVDLFPELLRSDAATELFTGDTVRHYDSKYGES